MSVRTIRITAFQTLDLFDNLVEFAAHGGKFQYFYGEVACETERISGQLHFEKSGCLMRLAATRRVAERPKAAQGIAAEILFVHAMDKKIGAESPVSCGFAARNAP
jgi:hypothetical protein